MLFRAIQYLFVVMLFQLSMQSLAMNVSTRFEYNESVLEQLKMIANDDVACVFIKPVLPHEDTHNNEFPPFFIESEKENEDDDELTSYEKYLKCLSGYIILFHLTEPGNFQVKRNQIPHQQHEFFSSDQPLYLKQEVFRI